MISLGRGLRSCLNLDGRYARNSLVSDDFARKVVVDFNRDKCSLFLSVLLIVPSEMEQTKRCPKGHC